MLRVEAWWFSQVSQSVTEPEAARDLMAAQGLSAQRSSTIVDQPAIERLSPWYQMHMSPHRGKLQQCSCGSYQR